MFIMTVFDSANFDAEMHQSVHSSAELARAYAVAVAVPQAEAKVEPEWRYAIRYGIWEVPFIG